MAEKAKGKAEKARDKMHTVMSEFKRGTLHSGGSGKVVTNRKQAVAIGISEALKHAGRKP